MVILITGASHTGKTLLAQKLLEAYRYPYLSVDHLKMGLIRSGQTALTPYDDDALTGYLWSIVREIVKTAVENAQNLIVEGCYIPFDWRDSFNASYLRHIRYLCLIMSRDYLRTHFGDVTAYENAVEHRMPDPEFSMEQSIAENCDYLRKCKQNNLAYALIDKEFRTDDLVRAVTAQLQNQEDMIMNKSIEELEQDVWGEPELRSHVAVTCTQARKKPIGQLTDEELRCMIGQKTGLPYLLPLAVAHIQQEPLLEASMFPGDLLTVMLRLEPDIWAPDTLERFRAILRENRQTIEACEEISASRLQKYIG
ncbi:MAG: hypothetical protein J5722_08155 [Oscillospiraceae bacterium]|nr:hypothetical protein [Oscillospiraceae bacterium]